MSNICNKSAGQLNALNRLNRYLGFEGKKILIKSFIYGPYMNGPKRTCSLCSFTEINT